MELFADGISLGKDNGRWKTATDFVIPGNTKIIAVAAKKLHHPSPPGILGSLSNGLVTSSRWKCSNRFYPEWNFRDFDDHNWSAAKEIPKHHGGGPPGGNIHIAGIDQTAMWIWSRIQGPDCYCRVNLQ